MISVEEVLIDRITEAFHHLRAGSVPPPIPVPDDLPDNEVRQLITYVNRFLVEFTPFAEAMEQIAQGELDTRPLLGRMKRCPFFQSPPVKPAASHLEDPTDRGRRSGTEDRLYGGFLQRLQSHDPTAEGVLRATHQFEQRTGTSQPVYSQDLWPLHER